MWTLQGNLTGPAGPAVPLIVDSTFLVSTNSQLLFSEPIEIADSGWIEFEGTGILSEVAG